MGPARPDSRIRNEQDLIDELQAGSILPEGSGSNARWPWLGAARSILPAGSGNDTRRRTRYGLVLEYGFLYRPCALPPGMELGEPKRCFDNVYRAVLRSDLKSSLVYCEGYAVGGSGEPVDHAWLTDGSGRAIDITWADRGVAYAGIPFRTIFVLERCATSRPDKGFIDDWLNQFPLLRELGDRPSEWLEPDGRGTTKLPF